MKVVRDVLIHRLWQDPAEVSVRVQEGVVHDLDDTRPTSYPRA